jgi:hypothetical protein
MSSAKKTSIYLTVLTEASRRKSRLVQMPKVLSGKPILLEGRP